VIHNEFHGSTELRPRKGSDVQYFPVLPIYTFSTQLNSTQSIFIIQ